MSWLRTTSLTLARQLSRTLDPRADYEPHACFTSFVKHWQQAYDIIQRSQPQHLHDDVLAVVNHLEQLSTLLVLEARAREINSSVSPAVCLEHLLSENLLDKVYEWAICTGKYENAVRLEQLKLYGSLISHYSTQVIAAEPFLRPLLKLLSGFRNELPPPNVESKLVAVLSQLCVALMQNMKFIDLFFLTNHTPKGSQAEFIIVRLLLSSVHREGTTGSAARDALLLCAKMSALSLQLADYMLVSNTCPVLATGLSGLYSLLPRTLDEKLHRLTPDDVNRVHKLTLFIDSLEFCNAVAQVAHSSIKNQLLDLLYHGFLVPVMGPALLQNGSPEQIAAMAYLELIVRCATPNGLLKPVLVFLIKYEYDGVRVLDVLLRRLEGDCQLSLVALSLMETLIDLNCEDVMLELVFKYLLSGHHLVTPYRHKISEAEPYREAAVSFLSLTPICCARPMSKTKDFADSLNLNGRRVLDFRGDDDNRRQINGVHDGIAMDNLVKEVKINYGNPNETLIGNYHAYLCDSRFEIVSRSVVCTNWSSKYDTSIQIRPQKETNNNSTNRETDTQNSKDPDSIISICTSGYETLKNSDSDKEPHSLTSLVVDLIGEIDGNTDDNENVDVAGNIKNIKDSLDREQDSLTSIGSCYDSLKYRNEDDDEGFTEDVFWKSINSVDVINRVHRCFDDVPLRRRRVGAETIIGPLLSSLLKKAAALLESDLSQNCRVTSLISKLISFPTPLLMSLLLCPGFVVQPNVPSLYQILHKLKTEIDELTSNLQNVSELVDCARVFLVQREMTAVKRTPLCDSQPPPESPSHRTEDIKRHETKRRSLSTSLSSMFGRLSSSPSSHQSPQMQQSPMHNVPPKKITFTQESYWNQTITLRTILNAVIFDEWIKELASLAEEHALRLALQSYDDDTYTRSVAL